MISLLAMLAFAPVQTTDWMLAGIAQEARQVEERRAEMLEEHDLERVRLSCYVAAPGAVCADGTEPYEGVIACNWQHIGRQCIMYDEDLTPVAVWTCHDVGGDPMLMAGTAIDVYRDSLERCYEMIGRYGDWVYIEWVPEDEAPFGSSPDTPN